jgi:hypothetical protein
MEDAIAKWKQRTPLARMHQALLLRMGETHHRGWLCLPQVTYHDGLARALVAADFVFSDDPDAIYSAEFRRVCLGTVKQLRVA